MAHSNNSDARFLLKNSSIYDFYQQGELIEILPHSKKPLMILAKRSANKAALLSFDVLNAITGYKQVLSWAIPLSDL